MESSSQKPEKVKAAEEQLAHFCGVLLQAIFDNLVMGVYVLDGRQLIYVNRFLAQRMGYAQDELIGQQAVALIHPEDRGRIQEQIERWIQGENMDMPSAFRCVDREGRAIEFESYGSTLHQDGRLLVIGVMIDVSARHAVERAHADQLNLMAELIETIPNPLFYKDAEGHYLGCNRAAEQFFGRPRAEMIGRTAYELKPGNKNLRALEEDRRLMEHPGSISYEASVTDGEGEERDVIFNKATFHRGDGTLGGLVGVIIDITDRKQKERLIRRQAHVDTLTGLPNRRALVEQLEHLTRYADWSRERVALLFIDLDHFKDVNDSYGHHVGDQLLVDSGARIRAGVREADQVFRLGGDEFVALISSPFKARDPQTMARRILRELARPFPIGNLRLKVTASIGIALAPGDGKNCEELLCHSDHAMYLAKAEGRNCVCVYSGTSGKGKTGVGGSGERESRGRMVRKVEEN